MSYSKKIKTAIYLIENGHLCPIYVGFAINSKKEIHKKLNQLKTLTKTYFLEGALEHGLFPREIIVPVKQKAIYRLKEGGDIINYIGSGCSCINCINLKIMVIIILNTFPHTILKTTQI